MAKIELINELHSLQDEMQKLLRYPKTKQPHRSF